MYCSAPHCPGGDLEMCTHFTNLDGSPRPTLQNVQGQLVLHALHDHLLRRKSLVAARANRGHRATERVRPGIVEIASLSLCPPGERFLPPEGVPHELLTAEFVMFESDEDKSMAQRMLGLQQLPRAVFYRRCVVERVATLRPQQRDAVVLQILRELPQLQAQDRAFADSLRVTPFVPTGSGQLRTPSELYDPRSAGPLTLSLSYQRKAKVRPGPDAPPFRRLPATCFSFLDGLSTLPPRTGCQSLSSSSTRRIAFLRHPSRMMVPPPLLPAARVFCVLQEVLRGCARHFSTVVIAALGTLGLRSRVDQDTILQAARQVELLKVGWRVLRNAA